MARRGVVYHWRHGWIPLTPHAALQKAHGSHEGAKRYMPGGQHSTVDIRRMSDDHLADHLVDVGDDEKAINLVLGELDRRDRVAAAAQKRRADRDAARDAEFERQTADGVDPEAAYAKVYGVSEERQRRQEAISSLRGNGYKGAGFDQLARSAFTDHANQAYMDAENVTRGHMLNKAGQSANVHPLSLFSGPESRARKYASGDLLAYWQQHGRPTVDDFKAGLLGGAMRSSSTAAFA